MVDDKQVGNELTALEQEILELRKRNAALSAAIGQLGNQIGELSANNAYLTALLSQATREQTKREVN